MAMRFLKIISLVGPGLIAIWNLFFGLVDWLSRFDFVIKQSSQNDWVADVISAVLSIPPPINLVVSVILFLAFAVLVYWSRSKTPAKEQICQSGLNLLFEENVPGCRVGTKFQNGVDVDFYRIKVENSSSVTQHKCRGQLINIEKKDSFGEFVNYGYAEQWDLTWGPRGLVDPVDLRPGDYRFLDVFCITALGRVLIATENLTWSHSLAYPFVDHGPYRLTVRISSEESPPQNIQLVFVWTGLSTGVKVKQSVSS